MQFYVFKTTEIWNFIIKNKQLKMSSTFLVVLGVEFKSCTCWAGTLPLQQYTQSWILYFFHNSLKNKTTELFSMTKQLPTIPTPPKCSNSHLQQSRSLVSVSRFLSVLKVKAEDVDITLSLLVLSSTFITSLCQFFPL